MLYWGSRLKQSLACVDHAIPEVTNELYEEQTPFQETDLRVQFKNSSGFPETSCFQQTGSSLDCQNVILVIESKEKVIPFTAPAQCLEQERRFLATSGTDHRCFKYRMQPSDRRRRPGSFFTETVLETLGIFVKEKEQFSEKKQKGLAKKEKMVYIAWIPNRAI